MDRSACGRRLVSRILEDDVMVHKNGSTHYTKWMFMENGRPTVRRIQRIEIQARDGRLYVVTGERLPDFVVLSTGHAHRGESVAQIIERPNTAVSPAMPDLPARGPWPAWRDVLHVVIGLSAIAMMNFVVSLAQAAF